MCILFLPVALSLISEMKGELWKEYIQVCNRIFLCCLRSQFPNVYHFIAFFKIKWKLVFKFLQNCLWFVGKCLKSGSAFTSVNYVCTQLITHRNFLRFLVGFFLEPILLIFLWLELLFFLHTFYVIIYNYISQLNSIHLVSTIKWLL